MELDPDHIQPDHSRLGYQKRLLHEPTERQEENQFTLEQVGSLEKIAYAIRDNAIKHAQRKFPTRDRALTEVLRELPSPAFASYTSFLDVISVTQRDIQDGRG